LSLNSSVVSMPATLSDRSHLLIIDGFHMSKNASKRHVVDVIFFNAERGKRKAKEKERESMRD